MNITKKKVYHCIGNNVELLNNKKGERKSFLLHSLLKCKTCSKLWNRDANSSRNQRDLAKTIISGGTRPQYLRRAHLNPV